MSGSLPAVLYANEAGGGRGHIRLLAQMAQWLGVDLPSFAALGHRRFASDLTNLGMPLLSAPPLGYTQDIVDNPLLVGNASWADYLFGIGLSRPATLRPQFQWWIETIYRHNISILVAEYAPIAMLAARYVRQTGWDMRVVCVGTGYGAPPSGMASFTQLMPQHNRVVVPQPKGLAQINAVVAELGMHPLPNLPALYDVDLTVPIGLPFLDPYFAQRPKGQLIAPDFGDLPPLGPLGDAVFAYFPQDELRDPALVEALASLPYPRRAFVPQTDKATCDRLADAGVQIETSLPSPQKFMREVRVSLHASAHGSLCLAALAGIPQVGLPQHLEHGFYARAAEKKGILQPLAADQRTVAAIHRAVQTAYEDTTLHAHTAAVASDLRSALPAQTVRPLAQDLARLRGD